MTTAAGSILAPLRARIDAIDEQLVTLVAQRMHVVDEVVTLKQAHGVPARLDDRVEEVVSNVRSRAERLGAPADLAEALWRTMIEWVIAYEDARMASGDPAGGGANRLDAMRKKHT